MKVVVFVLFHQPPLLPGCSLMNSVAQARQVSIIQCDNNSDCKASKDQIQMFKKLWKIFFLLLKPLNIHRI